MSLPHHQCVVTCSEGGWDLQQGSQQLQVPIGCFPVPRQALPSTAPAAQAASAVAVTTCESWYCNYTRTLLINQHHHFLQKRKKKNSQAS